MNETTVLTDAHRNRTWVSTLTGAEYRWNEGWEVKSAGFDWHAVRPGVVTNTVYARSGEKFQEVAS